MSDRAYAEIRTKEQLRWVLDKLLGLPTGPAPKLEPGRLSDAKERN